MRKLPAGCLLILLCTVWYGCRTYKPIRIPNQAREKPLIYPSFQEDQVLVIYKNPGNTQQSQKIREAIANAGAGVDTASITVRRCNDCEPYIELWNADNIHTTINGSGLTGGSGGRTRGVGEDTIAYYSLNYFNALPKNDRESDAKFDRTVKLQQVVAGAGKDTIIVAVLDTGIDTVKWVHNVNLWTNPADRSDGVDEDANCYPDDVNGWNFIDGNNQVHDDNPGIHGSLVSQYIINEFQPSSNNFVWLMALKTHDKDGRGDLFSSLCAINYAANHGANIINASWGFYYYYDEPHRYLSDIITSSLAAKGILFVTASGNQTPESDAEARLIYSSMYPGTIFPDNLLRNLRYHTFYPATLSDSTNVVTVATSDMARTSTTQNYSDRYVDLGVIGDIVLPSGAMKFNLPFTAGASGMVSGSSFATAIATGKIGAYLKKATYVPGINKTNCFTQLAGITDGSGNPVIATSGPLRSGKWIKDGRFTRRTP